MQLPVINISSLVGQTNEKEIESVSNQIVDGLKEFGFIYISEHGISQECIKQSFDASKRLFQLDSLQKEKFSRSKTENWGYVPFRMETFEKGRPFDLKECFNYYPSERNKGLNELVPNLEDIEKKLFDDCTQLTYLLMKAINTALPTDDKNYLRKTHDIGDVSNNPSAMRLLYYPPIERQDDTVQGQLRCGEHSDYGTITLLFQDEAGGLQVCAPFDRKDISQTEHLPNINFTEQRTFTQCRFSGLVIYPLSIFPIGHSVDVNFL